MICLLGNNNNHHNHHRQQQQRRDYYVASKNGKQPISHGVGLLSNKKIYALIREILKQLSAAHTFDPHPIKIGHCGKSHP